MAYPRVLNPVERRIGKLCQAWLSFRADDSKRLLVWHAPDNAMRMIQGFYEIQKHETEFSTGDLFIVFDVPFDHSIQYSRELKEALAGQYAASREELKQQGIAPDWDFSPGSVPDSAAGFVNSLRSFGIAHQGQIGHLVAVLTPSSVTEESAFGAWLSRVVKADFPQNLRFLLIEPIGAQLLDGYCDSVRSFVQTQTLKIDGMVTAQETFAQEGGVGPGAVFRNYLMDLASLVEKGSAGQVKVKAADALAFAQKQKWADQEVVIAVMVAGALLKERRFEEAAQTYRDARQAALKTVECGHPAGKPLVLQTWFGEAGVHLAAEDAKQAGKCYDEAAVVAQDIPHPILAIEALRMGAFCGSRMKKRQEAIEKAQSALLLGRCLKQDEREMSTLPIAAVDLLRAIDPDGIGRIEEVKRRLLERSNEARRFVEQRAAALEDEGDVSHLAAAEEALASATAQAEQDAAAELDKLVAENDASFQSTFAEARELLGPQWPLFCDVALPLSTDNPGK